jgi:hypothetical protein
MATEPLYCMVEIPKGSRTKYETPKGTVVSSRPTAGSRSTKPSRRSMGPTAAPSTEPRRSHARRREAA